MLDAMARRSLVHGFSALALTAGLFAAAPAAGQHDHGAHPAPSPPPAGEDAEVSGLRVPDLELVDQDGRPVRFHSDLVAGKVVAMNFIFTTCTTVCPPMGATFAKLQKELGERFGRDVHLISVSVDPVTDTPQRLKAWGERFGARPGWSLVTGPKLRVDELLKALQVFTPDYADHSPTVLVGSDRTGVWKRAYGLAPASKLVELLTEVETADGGAGEKRP